MRTACDYPAVLFTVFEGDTRVDPLHARKLCAALQHGERRGDRPVLIRRETDVGHGARAVSRTIELSGRHRLVPRRPTGPRVRVVVMETQALHKLVPMAGLLGIELVSAATDEVAGRIAHRPDLCTGGDVLHGGAVMALADTIGAVCAFLNLPEGAGTSTIESKTNFFRACRGGTSPPRPVRCTSAAPPSWCRPTSRDAGKRVAQVTQTQAVLQPGP